jgi:hypothetical protein
MHTSKHKNSGRSRLDQLGLKAWHLVIFAATALAGLIYLASFLSQAVSDANRTVTNENKELERLEPGTRKHMFESEK